MSSAPIPLTESGAALRCGFVAGAFLVLRLLAPAATYHVSPTGDDAAAGSAAAPWATLTKAGATLVAGDTAIIHAGTYAGQKLEPAHSGEPGRYIAFKAAPGEAPPVITASPGRVAIVLSGNHHIWIEGLKISGGAPRPPLGAGPNLDSWARLTDASHNVFLRNQCEFAKGNIGFNVGGPGGSHFNRIAGNSFKCVGTFDNGKEPTGAVMAADVFSIGSTSSRNLVEENDFRYGGHNAFEVLGTGNLVRGNFIDNNWAELGARRADGTEIGYRAGVLSAIGRSAAAAAGVGYNLFEDNIVTGTTQTKYPESRYRNPPALKIEGTGQIVRGNFFIANLSDALSTVIRAPTTGSGVPFSRDNHIYHNTFFGNGGALWRIINYDNDPVRLDGNVFLNNLAAGNRHNREFSTGDQDADVTFSSSRLGPAVLAHNRFSNNALSSPAGPAAIFVRGAGLEPLAAWQEKFPANFSGNLAAEPRFVAAHGGRDTREEFELAPDSPLIDAGAFLTRTADAAGDKATAVTVADAGFFFPGIPELAIPGDLVRIGANAPVRVTGVDYGRHMLTLAAPVSWSGGAVPVSLDYQGRQPDIGAREFHAAARP